MLVTGADGNIGRMMIPALLDADYAVTAFDRAFRDASAADRVIEGDGRDQDAVREALRDATALLHLAGIPDPDGVPEIEIFTNNTAVTYTVLQLAGEAGVRRAAIASSGQVIGYMLNSRGEMPPYYPIDEESPEAIEHAYPLSKHADEATLRMMCRRFGMSGVALRLPLVTSVEGLADCARDAREHPKRWLSLGGGYITPEDARTLAVAAISAPFEGFHVVLIAGPRTLLGRPTRELIAEFAPDAEVRAELPGFASPIDTTRARELLGYEATGFIEFETQR